MDLFLAAQSVIFGPAWFGTIGEFVKNAEFGAPHIAIESVSSFSKISRWFLIHMKVWEVLEQNSTGGIGTEIGEVNKWYRNNNDNKNTNN